MSNFSTMTIISNLADPNKAIAFHNVDWIKKFICSYVIENYKNDTSGFNLFDSKLPDMYFRFVKLKDGVTTKIIISDNKFTKCICIKSPEVKDTDIISAEDFWKRGLIKSIASYIITGSVY